MQQFKVKLNEQVQIIFEDNSLVINLTPQELKDKISPVPVVHKKKPTKKGVDVKSVITPSKVAKKLPKRAAPKKAVVKKSKSKKSSPKKK